MSELANLNSLDLSPATLIASVSTQGERTDRRWTELKVYFVPTGALALGARRWIAEVRACTANAGEKTWTRRLAAGTLDRALTLFDPTDLARMAEETARDWAEETGTPTDRVVARGFMGATDEDALKWLYDGLDETLSYPSLLERDFGMGESTVRAALKSGNPVKVPLLRMLRWFNRDQFRADNKAGGAK